MKKKCSKDKLVNTINSLEKSANSPRFKELSPFYAEYMGRDFKTHAATEQFVARLAADLLEYADKEDSLFIEEFAKQKNMLPTTIRDWSYKHDLLRVAYKEAKEIIGRRRESGAITRKYNDSTIHKTMAYYSDIWRDLRDEEITLKQKAIDNQPAQKVIVIDKFID